MVEPCEIWFQALVISFIVVMIITFIALMISLYISHFTEGGNVVTAMQEKRIKTQQEEIDRLNDELSTYKEKN